MPAQTTRNSISPLEAQIEQWSRRESPASKAEEGLSNNRKQEGPLPIRQRDWLFNPATTKEAPPFWTAGAASIRQAAVG
jgi:hypothetical protein